MKALILRKDAEALANCAHALIAKGFQVTCVESRAVAWALLRLETIDFLLMDEQIDGQLTHALALAAERKNPYVSAIFVTDRTGPDMDELFVLIPCLYGLVGADNPARLFARLALASIENFEEAEARVNRLAAMATFDDGMEAPDLAVMDLQGLASQKTADLKDQVFAKAPTDMDVVKTLNKAGVAAMAPSLCQIVTVPKFMHHNAKAQTVSAY